MEKETDLTTKKASSINFMISSSSVALIAVGFAAICFGIAVLRPPVQSNITIIGEGSANATPDMATINVTIKQSGITAADAQNLVDAKTKELSAMLESSEIDSKDIILLNYSTKPKYSGECQGEACEGRYKIIAYEAAQSIQVRMYKIESASQLVSEINKLDIDEVSEPVFSVSNIEKLKSEARILAIKNSTDKAQEITKAMGVKIRKIVKFEEENFAENATGEDTKPGTSAAKNDSLSGENIVKSKVAITYSIQ
ncbi:MAG: oxidative stress defense protein [Rickettsiaceae bacterium]|jgi:uncharacterized protein YggE|nr:oxidative stress defense protein [Rickettsiaceae bacterium]